MGRESGIHCRRRVARIDAGASVRACRVVAMATWDDVRRVALALPEAREELRRGLMFWIVKEKLFVWERPLRKTDLRALGDDAPDEPILGARVEHVVAKDALVADNPDVYFTIPHFDGYPAVLILLQKIAPDELEEVIIEAWLARAPKRLAQAYIAEHFPNAE